MLLYAACAVQFKNKKRAAPTSYKIIRYRKRLFCELDQLFAGYVEYSNSPRGKVLFHKFFSFCKQAEFNRLQGSISFKIDKISAKIADCHNMTYEECIFASRTLCLVFFACRRIGVKMAKKTEKTDNSVPNPLVESGVEKMIQIVRGKQVLLDRDLAVLYGVETKYINRAVKRNPNRFPDEFYFELTKEESLRCQDGTIKTGRGQHSKYSSYAFTEQGVAMLSAVLHSEKAIRVSIDIMKAFVAMRHFILQNGGFINRLSNVEAKLFDQDRKNVEYEHKFDTIFEALDRGELKSKGLFYNNQEFDAYVFVCALIRQAKKRIVLVDRYVTEKTLTMMLKREKGVSVTIYTYDKSKVLEVDLATYNEQYPDSPMQVLPSYGMHDRFLFIDDTAYHFGASLKDLGKNTFFFTQEDFTLEEVLKKSKKMRK